jgi:hypothetical protein
MKTLNYSINHSAIISFVVLILATIMSCSTSDDSITAPQNINNNNPSEILPTLTLVSGEEGIYQGVVGSPTQGTLQHQIKAEAPDGFVSLEIFKVLDNVATSYILFDTNHPNYVAGSNTFTHTLNYIMNDVDEPGHGLRFKAVVTDANNNKSTLDFAEVDLRLPMLKKTVTLKTLLPPVGDITIPYYLKISGINVTAVNHDVAVNVDNDQFIAMAFSVNDDSGFYLSSLLKVEEVISNGMQQKSTTKFKHYTNAPVTPLFTAWDIYDVYNVESAYSALSFNANEQKVEEVSNIGKIILFKTDDNRTGMMQVKGFSVDANIATIVLDMYVTQLQ